MSDTRDQQDEANIYGTEEGFRKWLETVQGFGRLVEVEKRVRTGELEVTYRALVSERPKLTE